MSRQTKPIPVVQEFFGTPGTSELPTVAFEFYPKRGWVRAGMKKQISRSWARKLQREGVTAVQLHFNGRNADFQIKELV